jgi:hypothetical protein
VSLCCIAPLEFVNLLIGVGGGNGKVFDLDPDVIFNPSVTSIGGVDFSVHTNFKFSIHNTAWVKHDEVSISKMEKDIQRK